MEITPEKAFKGKEEIVCRYVPRFPEAAEREYIKLANEYMRLLKESIEECMPELAEVIQRKFVTDSGDPEKELQRKRVAGFAGAAPAIESVFQKIMRILEQKVALFDIRRRMDLVAGATRKLTVKEWKKAIRKAIGIDIYEDYYMGDFFRDAMEKWVSDNVDLITTIPRETLGDMKKTVYEGYLNGKPATKLTKEIQERYQAGKSHARLIARDQMGKLNGAITQAQQRDAGVRKYMWDTCRDGRVRKDHKRLQGRIFSWDDPPVVDQRTGRRGHPGEDYQCRCIARPVLEKNNLHLPA